VTKWLAKANDDVLSHCHCVHPIAAGPGQLDCPWCGCGWLISCVQCNKVFTFAEVVDVDRTYRDLCVADFRSKGFEFDEADVAHAAAWMADAVAPLALGEIVVYLDGVYFPLDERDVMFAGVFAAHDLPRLPHAEAVAAPALLVETLGNARYWIDRGLPDRNDE
jgi:hypothetical protein